jgi:alkylhydroperoxidase family enzyme
MVDWALKLTRNPGRMSETDLEPLRSHGLDDRAILDLALIAAYYAYVNRLASGLGVEIEPGGPPHASRD